MAEELDNVKKFWDSEEPPPLHGKGDLDERYKAFSEHIASRFPENFTQGKLLDAGCGDGSLTMYVAKIFPGVEYYGCDMSKVYIAQAKELHPDGHWQQGCLGEGMEYEDDQFDVIFTHGVFQYLHPSLLDTVFKETARICKPGGTCVHFGVCDKSKFFNWYPRPNWKPSSWKTFIDKGGLKSYLTDEFLRYGSRWHRMSQVKRIALKYWSSVQVEPSESHYRSDLVLRK